MKRLLLGCVIAAWAGLASAQAVTQTGTVATGPNGIIAPPQPTTTFVQSCNSGAGGIVGQGSCSLPTGGGSGGGGAVFGPTADGSPAANPPVLVGGSADGSGTGTVGVMRVDGAGDLSTNLVIGGAAPSLTNPIWIANAEAADTSGTFTNGTQTTSVTNSGADGYASGLLSINGTYSTASGVFEESDDGGTTYYSVICARSDGTASETGYTALSNTNRQWSCPVGGNDSVRVRSTAVATGTVNVRVGISAPPPSSNTVAGTVSLATSAPVSSSVLAANQIVKGSAGTLYSFQVAADPTLSAAAWWVMIYNATTAPADGTVTPAKCYAEPAGQTKEGGTFASGGVAFSTGIVIGVSSTGCFTKTASTHAFITGDAQ